MIKTKFLFFSIFVILLSVNILYSQDNGAGWYGGQWLSSPPPANNNVSIPGVSSEGTQPTGNQNNQNNSITPIQGQTDEFGWFSFNAYCTGFTGLEWIAVPNSPSFFNESFDGSAEMWINASSFTANGTTLMSLGATSNKAFGWYVQSTGQFTFRIGSTELVHSGTAIPLNTWTHVAVTWTGGGPYTVTFYVNGAQSGGTMNNTGVWNSTLDSLRIGRDQAFTSSAFHGSIDEAKFWEDQRTSVEIRDNRFVGLGDNFNANSGNALTSSSSYAGLRCSWNFNTGNNPTLEVINNKTGYLRGSLSQVYSPYAPTPMAYNYAGLFPGGTNDYIVVPDNSIFDQTADGSIEAWIYMTTVSRLNTIYHKGTSFANTTLAFYVTASNKVGINIGPHNYISSGPTTFVANRWYHVAATWSGGPNFTVRLYVNGVLDNQQTFNQAMSVTADPVWIGRYYTTTGNFMGYIDEVRLWSNERRADQIRQCMFASGRALLPDASLIALWNFDGNLMNRSATAGIDGSFSTGGTNNCRLSSYVNENSTGALGPAFIAHPTVLNRTTGAPFPFPAGYIVKPVGKPINDLQTTWDTINVPGSLALSSIEVFLSVQHTYIADLSITLRAPNGQNRDLSSVNGSFGDHILTIFVDGSTNVTTAAFTPPWSNTAGPEATMGSFGSTNVQGNWILSIADGAGGDTGFLVGWGLRFNGAVTVIDPNSNNIPNRFALYQNYPNPFNPVTTVRFDLAKNSDVKLRVYDILGREVKTLVNEFKNAGSYDVKFDASNIASGTYFYKIEAGDFVDVKKMVIVK